MEKYQIRWHPYISKCAGSIIPPTSSSWNGSKIWRKWNLRLPGPSQRSIVRHIDLEPVIWWQVKGTSLRPNWTVGQTCTFETLPILSVNQSLPERHLGKDWIQPWFPIFESLLSAWRASSVSILASEDYCWVIGFCTWDNALPRSHCHIFAAGPWHGQGWENSLPA